MRAKTKSDTIHPSHKMTKWYSDIRSPAGTPRFYGVRECKKCKAEEMQHSAGHFMDKELTIECYGKSTYK